MRKRIVLWFMLLSCVIVHILQETNLNVAIVSMVKHPMSDAEIKSEYLCYAPPNSTSSTSDIANKSETLVNTTLTGAQNQDATLDWSERQQNIVFSGYGLLAWGAEFLGGVLTQKYSSKLVVGYSTLVGSILCAALPVLAHFSYEAATAVRIVQGFCSSIAEPAGLFTLIGHWSPPNERGKFSTILLGVAVGTAGGFPIFGLITRCLGWEWTFYFTAIVGVIWFWCWQQLVYDTPDKHPTISKKERTYINESLKEAVTNEKLPIPWVKIATSLPVLVSILSTFGMFFSYYTLSFYLPTYYKVIYGLDDAQIGLILGIIFMARTVVQFLSGIILDSMVEWGCNRTLIRKLAIVVGSIISGIILIGILYVRCNLFATTIVIGAFTILSAFISSGSSTAIMDMAPNFSGVIQGINFTVCSTAGVLPCILFDYLYHRYDTLQMWDNMFLVNALLNLITGILFLIFASSELQSWNFRSPCSDVEDRKLMSIEENGKSSATVRLRNTTTSIS